MTEMRPSPRAEVERILVVVDDDADIRTLLADGLGQHGFRVSAVGPDPVEISDHFCISPFSKV